MAEERVIPHQDTTDRVTFTVLIDGTEISGEYQVAQIVVTKAVNKIASAKLVIFDGDPAKEDFEVSNKDEFIPGKEIEIKSGYHSTETTVFKGIVIKQAIKMAKKGRSVLMVECRDEAIKMTIGRKNAYFFDSTDSDIMEEVIGNYSGLTPEVESTTASHTEMVQYYSTDWDFLISRAEVNGMLVFNSDGALKIAPPDPSQDPLFTLVHGSSLHSFEAEMDARTQYKGVNGKSWDFAGQELLELEGEDPGLKEAGNLSASDLSEVIGLESFDCQHPGQVVDTELQAWTDSVMMRSRLAKIRGRATCQGVALPVPGDVVELSGVGERFNGNVFIGGIRHQITSDNWTTDIEFGYSPKWFTRSYRDILDLPAGGLVPGIYGLQIGIVVALADDPEGEDRVQVRMPMVSTDEEGVWARVASLDAGDSRGSFFRPEIDDEVILGFLNGDPRDPIIVGMLNSSAKPAPHTADDDNHEKGFVTRSGMRVWFNDDEISITIDTPNGNKIVLSEDEGGILVEDENGNKMEMSSSGIDLESGGDINIKASGNINLEGTDIALAANASFKAEGGAGANLESSATTVVKGSLVQIN